MGHCTPECYSGNIQDVKELFQMVNLNGECLNNLPESLVLIQRGLYYGDSLFETLRVFRGRIPFLPRHWARLSEGLHRMRYTVPAHWSADFFQQEISRLAPSNARVRLTVWRSPGGFYAPVDDAPQFLLTAQELDSDRYEWNQRGLSIGCCQSVRLPVDALSGLKAPNAPRYVVAAQEARENGWDDVLLLNGLDHVCEATSSNIGWITGDRVSTPPLSEGPVTGVLRGMLPVLSTAAGLHYAEQAADLNTLLAADEVFLTNAIRGIQWVRSCEGKGFACNQTKRLHQALVDQMEGLTDVFY